MNDSLESLGELIDNRIQVSKHCSSFDTHLEIHHTHEALVVLLVNVAFDMYYPNVLLLLALV
jgi:hypothetical protein